MESQARLPRAARPLIQPAGPVTLTDTLERFCFCSLTLGDLLMAGTCIYTLEPFEHGGVIALVREVQALCQSHGHATHLLYTATNQVPAGSRWDKLRFFLRSWPGWETRFGFRGFAVPDWPMPLWASYAAPILAGRPAIQSAQMHVVVSGSNHCGLPAALLHKTYIVWIATLYEEELSGRAAAGDGWAKRMLNGPAMPILNWQEKLIFKRAALILTAGSHAADAVRRVHPEVSDRVQTMIYPVDTDFYKPPEERSPAEAPYLLFTARINDPRKNVGLLFRAFARLRRRRPDLRLILTGDPPDAAVRRLLRDSGVEASVVFAGYQTRAALARLYQRAELFVLPSLQEGLGISMLEALASGLPVVSTRCGGPESVIVDGQTGRLTANDDELDFAGAIEALLDQPEQLAAMRAAAHAHARATFSKQVIGGRLLEAFRSVYPAQFA